MDPRNRLSVYEKAHGSPLYAAPRKNINPSTTGGHIQEEISEITKWVNGHLASAGRSDELVTDLTVDMADGITLLHLVQELSKENLPRHFPNPMMRVQKLENLQVCVRTLQERGLSMKGIHADDIAGGNVKTILAVCHALKRFFTGDSKLSSASVSNGPGSGVTPPTLSPPPLIFSSSSSASEAGRLSFSSLDREDVALLGWLGDIVHRDISKYSLLYDGKILCDFANEINSEAVSEQDIITGSSHERLQIAFSAIASSLFVSPPKDLNIARLTTGKEDAKLRNYLTNCRSVYRQKIEMRQKTERKASSEKRAVSLSSSNMSREEVFQSLRSSSGAPAMPSSLEQRERAKVEARSLDGIRRQRRKNNSAGGREGRQEDLPFRSTGIRPERVIKHSSSPSTHRLSSSTNNLTSASTLSLPLKSSRDRGTIHGSHDRIPPSRRLHPPPHQRRPLSEIYVTGDPTYPLSRRATPKTQRLNQSIELLSSPESWELDGAQGRPMRDPSVSLSQPDDSALSPSSSTLFRSSHDTSLKPSQSVEHGLGPLRQVSAPSSSSSSVGYSTRKSDSVVPKSFAGGSSYTLPQTKKQSPTTPPSPTPPPLPSVPPPSSGVNQPTFVPPGGGRFTRKLPAYPVTESDSLAAEISDLQDRIALLSNQLLYEKADVYTRLHRAVIRERKRRQAMEKRLREFESLAQRLIHHYDNCFVHLAKEVASLRQEIARGNSDGDRSGFGTGSGGHKLYITREIDQLKEQVAKMMNKLESYSSHPSLTRVPKQPPSESLFMRKRANSESNIHSDGPFMRGSASSFKKLSKFFGEEPPRIENVETFLDGLGYSHLYPTFSVHQISLAELYQMDVNHLEVLGIPLGPRVRIMSELCKLEPLDDHKDS